MNKFKYSLIHTIENYSKKKPTPIKLTNLINYSNHVNKHQTIVRTQFIHKELPIRISKRIIELNKLPYDLLRLNSMEKVYNMYNDTFRYLIESKYPTDIESSKDYSKLLKKLKSNHSNINHEIATALMTYSKLYKYSAKEEKNINDILYNFYNSRLSIRFLITQHLEIVQKKKDFGLINKNCRPDLIIKDCILNIEQVSFLVYKKIPKIKLNIENDINLIYIDSHIQYIVTEILKNSLRAIMENNRSDTIIDVSIKNGKEDLIIKISDKGLGFNRKMINRIFNFTYTTANIENYIEKKTYIAGYGHGLGLSKIYTNYFGGDLIICPFEGVGTDVYIYLNRFGDNEENICDVKY